MSIKTGEFTSEEDQTIEDFVSTHGRKWSQLGKILNRNAHSVLARYNEQIKFKDSSQRGQFSLEEDLEILEFMFLNSEDVLKKDVKYYQKPIDGLVPLTMEWTLSSVSRLGLNELVKAMILMMSERAD